MIDRNGQGRGRAGDEVSRVGLRRLTCWALVGFSHHIPQPPGPALSRERGQAWDDSADPLRLDPGSQRAVPVSSYFRRVLGVEIPGPRNSQVFNPLKKSPSDWPGSGLGSSLSIPPQPHPVRFGGLFAVMWSSPSPSIGEPSLDSVTIERRLVLACRFCRF